jgi:hypothetical protein
MCSMASNNTRLFHFRIESKKESFFLYYKGIIAVSLAAGQGFDERTDDLSRMTTSPSLILIWSFVDPIQPKVHIQLLL